MDARIAWALAYIARRPAEPVSATTLAAAVNLSPSRFAHLFRGEVGTSPARFLHVVRMLHARKLLEGTFLSVKEVMARVGCNDPSHFSRDFRRFHGIGPRECRSRRSGGWMEHTDGLNGEASAAVTAAVEPDPVHAAPTSEMTNGLAGIAAMLDAPQSSYPS
jgi:AraC-like DNA-binding protein